MSSISVINDVFAFGDLPSKIVVVVFTISTCLTLIVWTIVFIYKTSILVSLPMNCCCCCVVPSPLNRDLLWSIFFTSVIVTWWFIISRSGFSVVTPSGFVITIVCSVSITSRTDAVGVRPSTPSRPFLTTNSLSFVCGLDCYTVASIWIFSSCCCCCFTVFTIFDDIALVTLPSPSVTLTVWVPSLFRYFNFRSLLPSLPFLTTVFSWTIWCFVTVIVASIWVFCCSDICSFTVFTIFNKTVVDSEPSGFWTVIVWVPSPLSFVVIVGGTITSIYTVINIFTI